MTKVRSQSLKRVVRLILSDVCADSLLENRGKIMAAPFEKLDGLVCLFWSNGLPPTMTG